MLQNINVKRVANYEILSNDKNFVNAENYLPKGYDKQGKVDYTKYIQKAINENLKVRIPNFPILINTQGLRLKSNTIIGFQEKSELIIQPTKSGSYQGILVEGVSNVLILNPKIRGERLNHLGNNGEWGMGVLIRNSNNIKISGANIENCWGDGVYIGETIPNSNKSIIIEASVLDYNRRNGISIISGSLVSIKDVIVSNTKGTAPGFGIDIEPNTPQNNLTNILVDGFLSYNNKVGVGVVLDNLIEINKKNVQIDIANLSDYYSNSAVELFVDRGYSKVLKNRLEGNINISNLKSINNTNALILHKSKSTNINLIIENVSVTKSNLNKNISSSELKSFQSNLKLGKQTIVR